MNTIENLSRPALLAIGDAVDAFSEAADNVNSGYGNSADFWAYHNQLLDLCKEHGINPDEAISTFA